MMESNYREFPSFVRLAGELGLSEETGVAVKLPYLRGEDIAGDKEHKDCYVGWRDFFPGDTMKKIMIFGTGKTGRNVYKQLKDEYEVVCFLDNDKRLDGSLLDGVQICGPDRICEVEAYDRIVIASIMGMDSIRAQLLRMGAPSALAPPVLRLWAGAGKLFFLISQVVS